MPKTTKQGQATRPPRNTAKVNVPTGSRTQP